MSQLGADPEDLRTLARSLRTAAGRLDLLSLGLTRRVRTSAWNGPDAERFHRQWQLRHRPDLDGASTQLAALARRLEHQATEQLAASGPAAGVGTPALLRTGPRPTVRSGLPDLPRREDRYLGGVDLRLGPFSTGLTGDLTVAELADGRRRVTLAETAAAGVVVAAGSSVDVGIGGPHGSGASSGGAAGEARARAGIVQRRSWEMDADDVDDLLVRLAAEQAAGTAIGVDDPVVRVAGLADRVAEWLTGEDPGWDVAAVVATGVPAPHVVEHLVEVELAAGAGVAAAGPAGIGGRAQGMWSLRVGGMERGDEHVRVVELRSSATATLTSTLLRRLGVALPFDAHHGVALRVEVAPPATGGATEVLVRATDTSGDRVEDLTARVLIGPAGSSAARSLHDALDALERGEPDAALDSLARLRIPVDRVEIASDVATLSGHSARAGIASGAGTGVGVTARGQELHLRRG